MIEFKYFNFIPLNKEEYPDRKRQGEEVTFDPASFVQKGSQYKNIYFWHDK